MLLRVTPTLVISSCFVALSASAFAMLKEVADEPARETTAREQVISQLQWMGVDHRNAQKDRIVQIQGVSMEAQDVRNNIDFVSQRELLGAVGFQKAAGSIAEAIQQSMTPVRRGGVAQETSDSNCKTWSSAARCQLFGMNVLASSGLLTPNGAYDVSFATIWSRGRSELAKSLLADQTPKGSRLVGPDFDDWLERLDPARTEGPFMQCDQSGRVHVVGIGRCGLTGDVSRDACAPTLARLRAKVQVAQALHVEAEQRFEYITELKEGKRDEAEEIFKLNSSMQCKRLLSGIREIRFVECVDPVSCRRMVVSVQELTSESSRQSNECRRESFAQALSLRSVGINAAAVTNAVSRHIFEGEYKGRWSFRWRPGEAHFEEQWTQAFRMAFIEAMSHVAASQATTIEAKSDLLLHSDDTNVAMNELKASGRKSCGRKPCVCDCVADGRSWRARLRCSSSDDEQSQEFHFGRELEQESEEIVTGAYTISQVDSYDNKSGVYAVVVKVRGCRNPRFELTLEELVNSADFSIRTGPRRFYDKDGEAWLMGIGVADAVDIDSAKRKSKEDAEDSLGFALGAEVNCRVYAVESLDLHSDKAPSLNEELTSVTKITKLSRKERPFEYVGRHVFTGVETHPVSGNKMHVTVIAVRAKDVR